MDSKEMWGYYFGLIRGFPLDFNIDSLVKRTPASDEDMNNYIEHLNCTPEQAFKEYKDFILNIKSEKEIYLKCIDTELAKGDSSKYTKNSLFYNFHYPWSSILAPVGTKLDFLKVFKEFVLNDNEEVLPDKYRVLVFLRNCLFVQN
jgi:hypothetical protein